MRALHGAGESIACGLLRGLAFLSLEGLRVFQASFLAYVRRLRCAMRRKFTERRPRSSTGSPYICPPSLALACAVRFPTPRSERIAPPPIVPITSHAPCARRGVRRAQAR